ncbi:putative PHD type zinc finger protein with BAH domain-containing protein [Mortierella sp. GBA43]|nr:putative PHD type zinc finger protein with BAH domain-containing protein [Mortierella sp. GBA43]
MSSLIQATNRVTSASLRDGTIVTVNDHVYMASEFIGESYYIGRVMEFGKQIPGKPLQVRIGWFYRPKDVMARKNHDPRLLVATMHSDMNPLSSIRGLCTVTHQAYIKDLEAYRKLPDHFYYSQLFDRYIHRFYDVLPVESVRNLPSDVAEELARRYQYIIVEAGTASEFTDAHRVCLICKRWCASGEALKCIRCQGFHHMLCINPPMLRKPSKGFAFQCALCTKLAMDSATSSSSSSSSSLLKQPSANNSSAASSGQNSPRGSPKQKTISTLAVIPATNGSGSSSGQTISRPSSRNENSTLTATAPLSSQDQKMSHMWPFRYFGSHADIQDIFDPDDRVYPRASSRVGTRYQAGVVKWDGPGQILATSTMFDDPQNGVSKGRSRRGGRGGRPSNKLKAQEAELVESRNLSTSDGASDGLDTPMAPSSPARSGVGFDDPVHTERGGDETVTLLYSKPAHVSDEYDLMDKALSTLQKCEFNADAALKEIGRVRKQDLELRDWTAKEIGAFEEGMRLYGHELFAIKKKVETRSMRDIVRFFYQWKKTERYQPVYSVFTKINKPNKKFKSVGRGSVTSPVVEISNRPRSGHEAEQERALDHDSIIVPTEKNMGKLECAHCGTTSTSLWRRAPGEVDLHKELPRVYCCDCGNDWVRYVALPSLADTPKEGKKLKGKDPTMKGQTNGTGKASLVGTESLYGTKRKRAEAKIAGNKKTREQSREPTRSPSPVPESPCAVCNNLSVQGEQPLCCQGCRLVVHRDCYGVPSPVTCRGWRCDTCLNTRNPTCSKAYNCVLCTKTSEQSPQALKRTTGNNWAHILCAIWIPETNFVDVDSLSPIESIGRIRHERWKQACSICKQKTGACVGCSEGCKKVFHVTCAREAGYVIAFEMQPTKNIKGGLMVPVIWCPNHELGSRKLIQIRDQPDALTDRNALQTYVHYYKQCDLTISSAMRKSRLVMAMNPGIGAPSSWQNHGPGHSGRGSYGGNGFKGTFSSLSQRTIAQEVCKRCFITASPMWWEEDSIEQVKPAHKGHQAGATITAPSHTSLETVPMIKQEGHGVDHRGSNNEQPSLVCHACFWDSKVR